MFGLDGHRRGSVAYAWLSPTEDSTRRGFFAVLRVPPINSPVDAAWAAIVKEQRGKMG